MKRISSLFTMIIIPLWLTACGQQSSTEAPSTNDATTAATTYEALDESLEQLKQDFNANQGKIRLLFIVGDTCGICLRGMADLNDAFIARAQNDARLLTLVVHVPTLGAEEKHVPAAIPLLDGPRVLHYWDGVGKSGVHFGKTLATGGIYAWDVWMAYGPAAEWSDTVPPAPEFWMHQLGPLDPDLKLDADVFASKTLALMNKLAAGGFADLTEDAAVLIADGTVIPAVAQPRGVAIQAHLMGKGGFHQIKKIQTITHTGQLSWDTGAVTLKVRQDVVTGLIRSYGESGNEPGNGSRDDSGHPLAESIDQSLTVTWQMHNPLFNWKDRGHQVQMDGMLKLGKSLAWKLEVSQENGSRQILYIDSHTGDLVQTVYLDGSGQTTFSARASDFREVDGFRFPFKIKYLDAGGDVIATETYVDIEITKA